MNRPNIEEIKARADAATPGPWAIDEFNGVIESHSVRDRVNEPSHDWEYRAVSCSLPEKAEDAEFIAASRADIPELLAYIAHLEARLENRELPEGVRWQPIPDGDSPGATQDRYVALGYNAALRACGYKEPTP